MAAAGRNLHPSVRFRIARSALASARQYSILRSRPDAPPSTLTTATRRRLRTAWEVSEMDKRFGTAACWLLVIPYIGLLWVPFYNSHDPVLFGFPFFYWYQLAWVPITAFLTWIAYRSMRHDD
ncbi:conserved hypothetical protein [Rhizobium rhizogenes K84]|uniref:DUF3311 domain-containing protein n=2 Tax=Rhizobium rhizogenes TaxID=359 RepID=B9J9Z6_RHIR8|nr:conserved hypothetical protein [Rhizobium rhizogenes K84]